MKKIKELAYEEKNNFDFIYNDVSFNKNNIKGWENDEGREHYYNFRVKKMIENDREIQKLIDDKKKIQEKYAMTNKEESVNNTSNKVATQISLL